VKYFDTLPKLIRTDTNLNSTVITNILARASIIPRLFDNPALYYLYDVQDGDTPETVAHKYYGDTYRYWIVLMMNQMLDPQWDWPLSSSNLEIYIADKYTTALPTDLHHYEKIITTTDNNTTTVTQEVINLSTDIVAYNNITTGIKTLDLGDSGTVTVEVTKQAVTNYNYELMVNESKRTIKLLNSKYVSQIEKEFASLFTQ